MTARPIKIDWWRLDVDEYLPATVPVFRNELEKEFKQQQPQRPKTLLEISDSLTYRNIDSYNIEIISGYAEPHYQTLNLFYWPQWKLRLKDGTELPATADSAGRFSVIIPPGKKEMTLRLEESESEKTGKILSLFGVIFVGTLTYLYWPKRQ
jgi:hypothetical protein